MEYLAYMNILFGDNRMQNSGNWKKGVSNLCFQEAWNWGEIFKRTDDHIFEKNMNQSCLPYSRPTPLRQDNFIVTLNKSARLSTISLATIICIVLSA